MKKVTLIALLAVVSGLFLSTGVAEAVIPSFTVSNVSGNSAYVTVHGDSNSNITLYYNSGSPSGIQTRSIGMTDFNGNFSSTIDMSTYGILSGYASYVIVNGQQSSTTYWPYATGNSGQISLSQTSVTISRGQTVNITIYGGVYVTGNNSNPNVVALSVNGYQATITGNNPGSANITFCQQSSQSACAVLYVTVQDNGSNQGITFSQNNVTVYNGQTTNVTIYGGGNNYYVYNNSNSGVVTTSINGSTLSLTANSNSGTATITVCGNNVSCGTLYFTSNGYYTGLIYPTNFQITNNILNRTLSQYSYANSVEAQAGDVVEFEIRIQTNTYNQGNNNSLVVDLKDNLPYGLTYIPGSTRVNGSQVVDGITSVGIYLNNFYPGQEQIVKFSAMVDSQAYSQTLTNQLTATMGGNTQTASSYVVINPRGTVLGAADIVTGPDGAWPIAMFLGILTALPIYYFGFYRKFRREVKLPV